MKTDPDVIRKHMRVPRTYREATGMCSNQHMWRDAVKKEPRFEWLVWTILFAIVVAWLIVAGLDG